MPRQQITFRLPGPLLEALRDRADEEDTSITRQVESALADWVQLSPQLTDPRVRLDDLDRRLGALDDRLGRIERAAENQGAAI